jgi:hypothetical protein
MSFKNEVSPASVVSSCATGSILITVLVMAAWVFTSDQSDQAQVSAPAIVQQNAAASRG